MRLRLGLCRACRRIGSSSCGLEMRLVLQDNREEVLTKA